MICPVCESKVIPIISDVSEPSTESGILWLHKCPDCGYKWLEE